ncbi:MAG: acyl-CoA thioesterase [Deltaproteobacteria bacterium]|nr:acyl-CoA thioesterase [Deltaproteobacteria bacterium]
MMALKSLPWDLPDPFTEDRKVEADEVDQLGHANNANYLRWCEDAGWGHTASVNCNFEDWVKLGRAMAIVRAELEFKTPCRAGDEISTGVWLVDNDERLTATRRFQIIRKSDGLVVFRANVIYATIDLESGRARRMPNEFKRAYAVLPSVAKALVEAPPPRLRRRSR